MTLVLSVMYILTEIGMRVSIVMKLQSLLLMPIMTTTRLLLLWLLVVGYWLPPRP